ncbi:hypothetical protein B1748_13960 [Paenibacillus sp. MY03]|jgi:integral membrane protein|uniref:DUF3817 domain-containing protein n=1 Tax=Paenibacillus agaridevorans TaxID=171404 RepID=A0A2R5ES49_9BACL|nr:MULTISPECIES: DUF3817 domain-containing protein [Paenibacillus]OUS75919.1 hypothetical protein B1748_13960 [Paenibacillus sp. MY03]GBG09387.1 hypothetical protein PAT3040_04031 [Paenibacillus agaridevorans]
MNNTAIGRLRFVGLLEGTSFLVLLLVAMPLKYWADIPEAVAVVGALHGGLFVLYLVAAIWAAIRYRWTILKLGAACIASVLPFGPFIFDRKILREEK